MIGTQKGLLSIEIQKNSGNKMQNNYTGIKNQQKHIKKHLLFLSGLVTDKLTFVITQLTDI